ncbi:Resolvase domain protein [Desulfofarcimen acetoxidans DSM 771]|uniref:Resolvase domain protein n=1 Tax=Desulfofarcimen acetoxidans (strain ATCC 49208 / DSM 771 / KCTC 5769 / VKM B-1644 / 5575) TaxID=485916 RepID=C8W2N6_DESAS|nr:recombinase family protein [Desulfofarcimen acetoxidans]ACV63720.1 Resolvase domain protein [Desulfofarcimen acetoxidans DSM 771]
MLLPPHVSGQKLGKYQDLKSTIDEKNVNIGGYIRVSTKKDGQKSSIQNQGKLLRQWAELNGYNLVKNYTDVKSGAYTYLRNEMQLMFKDVEEGKIQGIVAKEIARTSRDVMDILSIKRTLADHGAFFLSIKESYDSRTDDDEFLLIIHGGLAQKERKTTSSRVKITQIIKAKEGKTNVSVPAFGYMLSDDRQYLIRNPVTAPVFCQVIELFLSGWGQLKIAKWLNKQGIRTRRGGLWGTNSVRTILSNPVYLGTTIYNATTLVRDSKGQQKRVVRPREEWIVRENTHEPLITEEEYNKVQTIMRQRREKYNHEWSCDRKYLLSSILRCNVCKGKIYGFADKQCRSITYKYRCLGGNGKCNGKIKIWNMKKIDNTILAFIAEIFSDRANMINFIRRNVDLFTNDLSELVKKREVKKTLLEQINNAIKKQQLAFEQDIITVAEYKERMAELRDNKLAAQKEIDSLNRKLEQIDMIEEKIYKVYEDIKALIDNIDSLPMEEKFQLVNNFTDIFIDGNGNIVDVRFNI